MLRKRKQKADEILPLVMNSSSSSSTNTNTTTTNQNQQIIMSLPNYRNGYKSNNNISSNSSSYMRKDRNIFFNNIIFIIISISCMFIIIITWLHPQQGDVKERSNFSFSSSSSYYSRRDDEQIIKKVKEDQYEKRNILKVPPKQIRRKSHRLQQHHHRQQQQQQEGNEPYYLEKIRNEYSHNKIIMDHHKTMERVDDVKSSTNDIMNKKSSLQDTITSSTLDHSSSSLSLSNDFILCSDNITKAVLNDDYCDCPNGIDEPNTSACSNVLVQKSSFQCLDGMLSIHASRVNDGIIDCLDKSDERL